MHGSAMGRPRMSMDSASGSDLGKAWVLSRKRHGMACQAVQEMNRLCMVGARPIRLW